MLKRLGRVIWWLGALTLIVSALALANAARLELLARRLPTLQAESQALHGSQSALVSRYVPTPSNFHITMADLDVKFGVPCDALKDASAPPDVQKVCATLDRQISVLSDKIQSIQHADSKEFASVVVALALAVTALALWAVAFVLGGRFLLPPLTEPK